MAPSHLGDQQFRRPSFIEIIQTPGQFHHAQGAIRGTVELKPNRRYQRGPILGDDIQFNVRSGDELTLRGSPNRVSPAQFTQKSSAGQLFSSIYWVATRSNRRADCRVNKI